MRIFKRVIAVFIVVLTAFLLVPKGKAKSIYEIDGSKSTVYSYSDINKYSDKTSNTDLLDSYVEKITQFNSVFDITEDFEIDGIIPVECFSKRGTHLHIGIKYGFYVYTTKNDSDSNECEVFLFTIDQKVDTSKDHPSNGKMISGVSTVITPVLCRNYYYGYRPEVSTTRPYIILRSMPSNDISITYASNTVTDSNLIGYEDRVNNSNVELKGLVDANADSDDSTWTLIRNSGRLIIDAILIVLKVYIKGITYSTLNTAASILKECLDIVLLIIRGDLTFDDCIPLLLDSSDVALEHFGLSGGFTSAAIDALRLLIEIYSSLTELFSDGFPDLTVLFDTIYDIIMKFDKYHFHDSIVIEPGDELNYKTSEFAETIKFWGDVALDVINFGVSVVKKIFGDYKTMYKIYDGVTYCGSPKDHKTLRLQAKNNHKAKITNAFEYYQSAIPSNNYISTSTTLRFRRSTGINSGNYKEITTTRAIKLFDNNNYNDNGEIKYVLISSPKYTGITETTSGAIITNGNNTYSSYFYTNIEGVYTITAKADNGINCPINLYEAGTGYYSSIKSIKKGKTYEIRVNTSTVYGNHYITIGINVSPTPTSYTNTKTFTCNASGTYIFEIQHYADELNFNISSLSYSQYIPGYGRYVTCNVSYNKVDERHYKASLESGKTYTIVYSAKYDVGLKIEMEALYNKSTTYTCNKSGNYYFTINTSNTDVYYDLTSVYYSQTYYYTGYSYSRPTYASYTKENNKQYKVYLESGKTYSISYKCNYDVGLNIAYTQ